MEEDLETNFLHLLCSKRETGKKSQEQQVGALALWQTSTCPGATPRASAALQAVPNGLHCLAEGRPRSLHFRRDRANPAVTRGWDGNLTGDVISLTLTGLWDGQEEGAEPCKNLVAPGALTKQASTKP